MYAFYLFSRGTACMPRPHKPLRFARLASDYCTMTHAHHLPRKKFDARTIRRAALCIAAAAILMLQNAFAFAEFIKVGEFGAYRAPDGRRGTGVLFYNTETEAVTGAFYDIIFDPASFTLSKEQIPELAAAINKYLEWTQTAIQNKDTVQKPIASIEAVQAHFFNEENYYDAGAENTLSFSFESYTNEKHFLAISLSPLAAAKDKEIRFTPNTWYLEAGGAYNLLSYSTDAELIQSAAAKEAEENARRQQIDQRYQ